MLGGSLFLSNLLTGRLLGTDGGVPIHVLPASRRQDAGSTLQFMEGVLHIRPSANRFAPTI